MQNKPNFLNTKRNISSDMTKHYEQKPPLRQPAKQTQTNPIKPNRPLIFEPKTSTPQRRLLTFQAPAARGVKFTQKQTEISGINNKEKQNDYSGNNNPPRGTKGCRKCGKLEDFKGLFIYILKLAISQFE
jgi:hypothetical protein